MPGTESGTAIARCLGLSASACSFNLLDIKSAHPPLRRLQSPAFQPPSSSHKKATNERKDDVQERRRPRLYRRPRLRSELDHVLRGGQHVRHRLVHPHLRVAGCKLCRVLIRVRCLFSNFHMERRAHMKQDGLDVPLLVVRVPERGALVPYELVPVV